MTYRVGKGGKAKKAASYPKPKTVSPKKMNTKKMRAPRGRR